MKNLSISPEDLRRNYKSDYIQGLTKDATSLSKTIIGQERALKALQLGLGNQSQGFNVFVTGASGLGKETVIRELLESIAKKEASPKDWCYVLNFNDAYSPKYLSLPKGFGRELKKDLKKFLLEARVALNKNMTSKEYLAEKETITKELYKKELKLLEPIQTKAKEENFFIQRTPVEINAFPEKDGRPMTDQEFLELPKEEKDRIIKASNEFQRALQQLTQEVEKLNSTYRDKEELLEQRIGSLTLDKYLTKLKEKYTSEPDVLEFLEAIKMDVLERLQNFLKFSPNLSPLEQNILLEKEGMMPLRYEVNILVDNSETHGAPVVFEPNPTYHNLFGKIEKENQRGTFSTNFSLIRAGALHRANGGYLVLPIEGVLKNYLSWDSLKRTLKEGAVRIEDIGEQLGFLTTRSLRPKDIPLNVQVILIGKPIYYHLLYHYDDEFKKFFKVRADFDTSMPATDANIRDLLLLLDKVQQEKSLLPLSLEAKTRLLQYSHRLAEDQLRLSTKMGHLMDIYQEANHYAHQSKLSTINETLIEQTLQEKHDRSNLYEEKIQQLIEREELFIDVEGEVTGQVNGLAVIHSGDMYFGKPNRITASVSLGKGDIIDIEREVNLGGPIHSKGVLILRGYLAEKFGQETVLNLTAQLVFEQSYSEIDGDSASSTELYALLSSMSQLPIKQGIAVTGSVNQKGEVQPIGGVNAKVEGFFDICQQKGLTGEQGVMIPAANKHHLMLKEEVVEAVKKGQFHIWSVQNIEEGIELLTGVKAGKRLEKTFQNQLEFEKDSVFEKIRERLKTFAVNIARPAKNGQLHKRRSFKRY